MGDWLYGVELFEACHLPCTRIGRVLSPFVRVTARNTSSQSSQLGARKAEMQSAVIRVVFAGVDKPVIFRKWNVFACGHKGNAQLTAITGSRVHIGVARIWGLGICLGGFFFRPQQSVAVLTTCCQVSLSLAFKLHAAWTSKFWGWTSWSIVLSQVVLGRPPVCWWSYKSSGDDTAVVLLGGRANQVSKEPQTEGLHAIGNWQAPGGTPDCLVGRGHQRRRRVWRSRRGPGEFVIRGCLAPTPTLYKENSHRIFTFCMDPTGQLRGGSGPLDNPASYAAGGEALRGTRH